ncbi:MAG: adenylate/guanylate cyclase domain-containing protein [Desulfobacterales bacterium]|nr:adenylate/guanylate cyclase domain-containing protein [Desulfobacterales bacterium]
MAEEGFERKLAAILSADVEGYSRLMDDDEEATVRTLTSYRTTISNLVQQYSGSVVDSPGDNILAEFKSVVDAVNCAVKIQRDIAGQNAELPDERKMQFRIGVNLGDVIEEEDRIYGAGVNIAARLEGLADAAGICISGTAFDQVKGKLSLGYQFVGEQTVKNIPDPVRAYKVLMEEKDAGKLIGVGKKTPKSRWMEIAAIAAFVAIGLVIYQFYVRQPAIEPASVEKMAYPLPDKPSIAVLAFDNLSGDPEQEYFTDGLSEEIINALAKSNQLFVIARNSTFVYKGKPVSVKQVAEELGVRYVLEGSVRKSEDRVRVTAQLIDATTGHHLWSERYDRELKDIFAVQDEITMKIITALQVELTDGEQMRIWAKRIKRLDVLLKGMELISISRKSTQESVIRWGQVAQEVVDMAPDLAVGYRHLGWYHYFLAAWGKSPRENLKKAYGFALKAISLDEYDGMSHGLLGNVYLTMRQHEKAIAAGKRAIELDPNGADVHMYLGYTLNFAGRPDEALGYLNKAIRLNPFPPYYVHRNMGQSYLLKGQYEKALPEFKKALQLHPKSSQIHTNLAVIYILLGREKEARASADKALELFPNLSVSFVAKTAPYKNQADLELILDAMRKAGFPEGA